MKALIWTGNSYKSLVEFPPAVRREAGYQLFRLQQGVDPKDWKPMSSIGMGVREIRLHVDGEHRVIYLAKFEEGIYVLHAFQKKTQKTAPKDIELTRSRLNELIQQRKNHDD